MSGLNLPEPPQDIHETAAAVALLRLTGSPLSRPLSDARRVEAHGGPRAVLETRLGLLAEAAELSAVRDVVRWAERGVSVLSYRDPRYPIGIADLECPPVLLFARGELFPGDREAIAVIGTRQPSPQGAELATGLAETICNRGRTVVSGLAAGIDGAAHRAALAAGGRTVAVLGNGVERIYPAQHAELQGHVSQLLSPFLPDAAPEPANFSFRNALMAALSTATVIVEAGPRSGTRIQARHALALGRRLILMQPLLTQDWARRLVWQPGVEVIATPSDLTKDLR